MFIGFARDVRESKLRAFTRAIKVSPTAKFAPSNMRVQSAPALTSCQLQSASKHMDETITILDYCAERNYRVYLAEKLYQ